MLEKIFEHYFYIKNQDVKDVNPKEEVLTTKENQIWLTLNNSKNNKDYETIEDLYEEYIDRFKKILKKEKINNNDIFYYILFFLIKKINKDENRIKKCINLINFPDINEKIIYNLEENTKDIVFLNFELPNYIKTNAITPYIYSVLSEIMIDIINNKEVKSEIGFFTTPLHICDYMVKDSIVNYLANQMIMDKNNNKRIFIEEFIKEKITNNFVQENKEKIIKEIKNIKFLDPSVGSGNFLLYFLNEIVYILYILDGTKNINYWMDYVLSNNIEGIDINKSVTKFLWLRIYSNNYIDHNKKIHIRNEDFIKI